MIFLNAAQTLQIVRAEAATTTELSYACAFIDENSQTSALGLVGSFDGATSGTNSITAVTAPTAGYIRRVSSLTVYNADTVASILTISLLDNATSRTIWKGLLIDGYTLSYEDERGFYVLTSSGEVVTIFTNVGVSSSSSSSVALHATTHEAGGTDVIPLDTLGTPSDITTLNASTTKHGLLPKLSGTATDNLKGDGTWSSSIAAANITGTLGLSHGGTNADLSATGGSNQLLKQSSSGAAITVGTIASANLSDTANIPLLNANNHFTGTGDQTFDGNVKPATTQCFSWVAKSMDTVYQAASDGFMTVVIHDVGGSSSGRATGLTDSANPPTTLRCACFGSSGVPASGSFTMPVKKGDFYKAVSSTSTGSPTYTAYWVPMGTAG